MAYVAEKKGAKRNYHDWYNYEPQKTTPFDAFWMVVFAVALCAGLPLMFAAIFHYGVPLLGKIW
ncbi:MAG: hypothetical protein HY898_20450 [Deltaproteobacteria bacterium]|nr:hypothetical protein [Deltaproteobacteria bacterium]